MLTNWSYNFYISETRSCILAPFIHNFPLFCDVSQLSSLSLPKTFFFFSPENFPNCVKQRPIEENGNLYVPVSKQQTKNKKNELKNKKFQPIRSQNPSIDRTFDVTKRKSIALLTSWRREYDVRNPPRQGRWVLVCECTADVT